MNTYIKPIVIAVEDTEYELVVDTSKAFTLEADPMSIPYCFDAVIGRAVSENNNNEQEKQPDEN